MPVLSWSTLTHTTLSLPISLRSIVILSSHLRLGLSSKLIEISPPKPCMYVYSPPYLPHVPPISSPWFSQPKDIGREYDVSLTCCTGDLKPRMACCSLVASKVGGTATRGSFFLSPGSDGEGTAWPGAVADTPAHLAQAAFISCRTSFTTSDPKQLSYTCALHVTMGLDWTEHILYAVIPDWFLGTSYNF